MQVDKTIDIYHKIGSVKDIMKVSAITSGARVLWK